MVVSRKIIICLLTLSNPASHKYEIDQDKDKSCIVTVFIKM